MARPKAHNIAIDLDLSSKVKVRPPKVQVPGCYGDFSPTLCAEEPFCGAACAYKCRNKIVLTGRFQVWMLHPESDCEDLEISFDTVQEARQYARDNGDKLAEGSGGLAYYDLRDSTGAPVKDFFEDGDDLLG